MFSFGRRWAARTDQVSRRRARLLAQLLCAALVLGVIEPVSVVLAQPASERRQAEPRERFDDRRGDRQRPDRREGRPTRERDGREAHGRHEPRERMTPEERRSLRRDVDEAGRDLYRR